MMTGEWHSRDPIQPLVTGRRETHDQTPSAPPVAGSPLGVAGQAIVAPALVLAAPTSISSLPDGAIAWTPAINPAWAALFLRAGGVVCETGNLLDFISAVARGGNIPTIVNAARLPRPTPGQSLRLDPAGDSLIDHD